MKYAVWGAPGAGALLAFDVTVPAQVQAARYQVASRQAGIGQVVVAVNKMDLTGGNRIDWYAGPMLAELLGVPERVAA
jgi:sulfate adenylyltransferase subunit 1 (EFTu-like GTPase family)